MALVNYSKDQGLAILELDAPPANTYSYELMRELDAAVLDARMDARPCQYPRSIVFEGPVVLVPVIAVLEWISPVSSVWL